MVSTGAIITTGVNGEGNQGWLGFDVITTGDWAGWTAFLRSLVARGLSGVALVIFDDRKGQRSPSAPSCRAGWQRCTCIMSISAQTYWTGCQKRARARVVATLVCTTSSGRTTTASGISTPGRYYQLAGHFDAAAAMLADAAQAHVLDFPARAHVQHQEQ